LDRSLNDDGPRHCLPGYQALATPRGLAEPVAILSARCVPRRRTRANSKDLHSGPASFPCCSSRFLLSIHLARGWVHQTCRLNPLREVSRRNLPPHRSLVIGSIVGCRFPWALACAAVASTLPFFRRTRHHARWFFCTRERKLPSSSFPWIPIPIAPGKSGMPL
jgi:hypothetical protein